jgi:hypothetical protein
VTDHTQGAVILHLRGLEPGASVVVGVLEDDAADCVAGPRIGVQGRPCLLGDGSHGLVELVTGFGIQAQPPPPHPPARSGTRLPGRSGMESSPGWRSAGNCRLGEVR